MDGPIADSFVVAAEVKGAVSLLELDPIRRKTKLVQVLQVPYQRSKPHQKRRSSRIHHCTVRAFSARGVFKRHHALFWAEGHALHSLPLGIASY